MLCYLSQRWLLIVCLSLWTYSVFADFEFSRASSRWRQQRERNSDSYRDSADSQTERFRRPHHLLDHHERPLYRDHHRSRNTFGSVRRSESPDFQNQWGSSYRHTESDKYRGERNKDDLINAGRHPLVDRGFVKQRIDEDMKKDERYSGKSIPLINVNTDLFRPNKGQPSRKSHLPTQASGAENIPPVLGIPGDETALGDLPASRERARSLTGIKDEFQTQDSDSVRLSELLLSEENTPALVNSQRHEDRNRLTATTQERKLDSLAKANNNAPFGLPASSRRPSTASEETSVKAKGLILDENKNDHLTYLERFRGLDEEIIQMKNRENLLQPNSISKSKGDGERGLAGESIVQFQSGSFNRGESIKHLELGADRDYPLFGTGDEKPVDNLPQQEGKSKPWMNFRLFLDDDGKIKLEMSPSSGNMEKEQPKESEPLILSDGHASYQYNGNIRGQLPAGGGSHAFGKNIFAHNEPNQNDVHRFQPHFSENGEIGMPDPAVPHIMPPPFEQPGNFEFAHHHVPPPPIPMTRGQSKWGQPKLLSGKNAETNEKNGGSIEILESAAIPLSFDVDNIMTSGCKALRCRKACPGDLRKLSLTTGCPTCDCCPTVVCALKCSLGYEADVDGCPVCKCLLN